jgi:hypothetical protein
MVQKENIAVTAVMNLFHKYRYNIKGNSPSFDGHSQMFDVGASCDTADGNTIV